jgi:tetratricopeptide (TPR) repeat protein
VLQPLGADDARSLVEGLPERPGVSGETVDAVVDAAEGNPLFLEQLLAVAAEGELGTVPPTVEALLASRLDRLDPEERAVLERAAVAGREFWRGAVDELSPEEERGSVGPRLMALARRRLVHPDRSTLPGEDGFRFHHVLIREVAYAGIPKVARADFHERMARWLDGRGAELDELVGYHLEQAALLRSDIGEEDAALAEEAGERLAEAGMRALKRMDARAAINLLTRARVLLSDEGRRLELDCELGTAVKFGGDAAGAENMLDGVAERARARGDRRTELRARVEQLSLRLSRRRATADEMLELVAEAVPVFEAAGDEFGLARAWHMNAAVNGSFARRLADAEAAGLRALDHYRRCQMSEDWCSTLLAACAFTGPMPVREAIERCNELLDRAGSPFWRSFVLPFLAATEAMSGRFDLARAHLEEARSARCEFADASSLGTSWAAVVAEVELLARDPGAAEAVLEPACDSLRAVGDDEWLATNAALLADALYRQGRVDDALRLSDEALQVAPPDHVLAQAVARRVRAKALARIGRIVEAESLAYEAVALLSSTDILDQQAQAFVDLAEVLSIKGDADEAERVLGTALGLFEAKGNVVAADQVRSRLPALT